MINIIPMKNFLEFLFDRKFNDFIYVHWLFQKFCCSVVTVFTIQKIH